MITRCIPRPVSVPAATIRGMAGDQETASRSSGGRGSGRRPGAPRRCAAAGPAAVAARLLARTRAELPVLAGVGEREELLAGRLAGQPACARTRRAYAADVHGWLGWLAERGTDVLKAGRVHVAVWVSASAGPRRGGLHCAAAAVGAVQLLPAPAPRMTWWTGCRRRGRREPVVDPDYTATVGLARDRGVAPWSRPPTPTGVQRALRTAAVIRLLVRDALRVDEAWAARCPGIPPGQGNHRPRAPAPAVSTVRAACGLRRHQPFAPLQTQYRMRYRCQGGFRVCVR